MISTSIENSNSLIFLDKNRWQSELLKLEAPPDVVLLSQWERDEKSFQWIKPLVTRLIALGCNYFVCAGQYSESLHDFIDDVSLDISLNDQEESNGNIITTWHDTDTYDEVSDFFLHSTNVSNSSLIAILDEDRLEDIHLKKVILNLV